MVRFEPVEHRASLNGYLIWFGIWVFVTSCAAWLVPSSDGHGTHQQLGLPPCLSVILWNRPCPSCGMTTSFTATVHGQFLTAWNAHPFGLIGYILFTASAFACLYGFIKCKRINNDSVAYRNVVMALIIGFAMYGAIRFAFTHATYRPAERSLVKTGLN